MKLLYCHIDNFGKIHDFSADFSDGMHVIHEPNGWGKSTLAAFIKVMFFGFDTKREAGSFEKERNLYRPWQGGTYGGEVEFETGGRIYRISRTFGKTEKADEFHLYDCTTNLECDDFSWNIGEELFDLDAGSFKRSIFFSQNDCTSRATDAINAKLGNLVENTNDINNYESAQEYLKNLANQLSPNRVTGSIKKRSGRITAVRQELISYEAAEQGAAELRKKQQQATGERDQLVQRREFYAGLLKEASEESRKMELRKRYMALREEREEKEAALLPFQETFPNGMPDEELLAEQIASARRFEEDRNTLFHMEPDDEERRAFLRQQQMFAEGIPEDDKIGQQLEALKGIRDIREERARIEVRLFEKEQECLQQKAPELSVPPKFPVGSILGVLLLLAGIAGEVFGILTFRTSAYGPALVLGSAAAFCIGNIILVIGIRKRAAKLEAAEQQRKDWEEKQQSMKSEVEGLQTEEADKLSGIAAINRAADTFLRQYRADDAASRDEGTDGEADKPALEPLSEQQYAAMDENDLAEQLRQLKEQANEYRRLTEKTDRHEAFRKTVQKEQGDLLTYGRSIGHTLGADITAELSALATEAVKYRIAIENAEAARERVRVFEDNNDTAELLCTKELTYSLEEINSEIKSLDSSIEASRDSIAQYTRQLENLEEQLDIRDEKEQELLELVDLSMKEQKLYDTVTTAQDYLQRAREQFTARYMAPVSNAFRKYYDMLTGMEEDQSWQIDANIDFRIREQGELRETKWLSAGYQDLIGICMRLAMVDAMYRNEKPFLILDDPFVNLDETKTGRGMQLLLEVAKEYQILYFTCHSSREP